MHAEQHNQFDTKAGMHDMHGVGWEEDACMSEIHFVHNEQHNVAEHYTLWKMKNDNKNIKTYKKRESPQQNSIYAKKKLSPLLR